MKSNVKNCHPISYDERQIIRRHNQLTGFLEYNSLPGWQECEVRTQALRTVHDDFRGEPLVKEGLISSYLSGVRDRIDRDDFPFSEDIRKEWPNKPPIYVLRTRHNGELYVYDGQKRTLNACYNAEQWMRALLVDVDERRKVL